MKKPAPKQTNTRKQARKELRVMLDKIASRGWFDSYFKLGMTKFRKKLVDGTIVHFSVAEPGFYKRAPK